MAHRLVVLVATAILSVTLAGTALAGGWAVNTLERSIDSYLL